MHLFFFFNDTATTEIYTLSLHDALPISGVRTHAEADDRHLGDLLVAGDVAALDVRLHLALQDLHRARVVVAMHGEGHVGHAVVADVLHDDVDVDAGVGDRPEDGVGDARPVGYIVHRDLRFVAVEGHATDDCLFHRHM